MVKKAKFLFLLVSFLLVGSCGSFKKDLTKKGGKNEAIHNAILDFSNTTSLYRRDSVFSVSFHSPLHKMVLEETTDGSGKWVDGEPYQGIMAISIGVNYNKILLTDNAKVGNKGVKMPTQYIEKNNKLFYWWDDSHPLSQEILDILKKYNLLVENDLDGIIEFYDFKINDAQKGAHYYFCEDNLDNYKKVITNQAIGFYNMPVLNCNISN